MVQWELSENPVGISVEVSCTLTTVTFGLDKLAYSGTTNDGNGLDKIIDTARLTDQKNWTRSDPLVSVGFDLMDSPSPEFGKRGPSYMVDLVSNSTALLTVYIKPGFWLNPYIYARKSLDGKEWESELELCGPKDAQGNAGPWMQGSYLKCRTFGDSQVLVMSVDRHYLFAGGKVLALSLFDIGDIDTDTNTWCAKSVREIDINADVDYYWGREKQDDWQFEGTGSSTPLDMDWYLTLVDSDGSNAETDASLPPKGDPAYYLALAYSPVPSTKTERVATFTGFIHLPLAKDHEGKLTSNLVDDPWGTEKLKVFNQGDGVESGLRRDPSGRLQRYANIYGAEYYSLFFGTASPATVENGFGAVGVSFADSPCSHTSDNSIAPLGLYHIFTPGTRKYNTEKSNPDGSTVELPTTDIPVLEFIFYGRDKCQVNEYGTVRMMRDTKEPESPKETEKFVIGGVVDSPMPFPLENFKGQEISAGRYECGDFVFGSTKSQEVETSSENGWKLGYEASGKTTEGFGPAFKSSAEGGMASIKKDVVETSLSSALKVPASVESTAPWEEPEALKRGAIGTLKAEFQITGYQFLDVFGKIVNDGMSGAKSQGPKLIATATTMAAPSNLVFEPYISEVGDLESYTPERINERMKALGYDGYHNSLDGKQYDPEGKNYYGNIITRNAYPLADVPYLNFTWSDPVVTVPKFSAFNSSFIEQSWDFETSQYIGVSGGGGLDFFGIGEEFEAEALFGGTYSTEHAKGTLKETEWELEFEDAPGPVPNDKQVTYYEFRTYFLPVPEKKVSGLEPNHWSVEIQKYLTATGSKSGEGLVAPENIDTGSGCWRIVFVVTKIEYGDGRPPYNYDGKYNVGSVYTTND